MDKKIKCLKEVRKENEKRQIKRKEAPNSTYSFNISKKIILLKGKGDNKGEK